MPTTQNPTLTIRAQLEQLAAQAAAGLPTGCNGAGDPSRRRTKIVNGHRVRVWLYGWGDTTPVFEVDHSTEPLTIDQAAQQVEIEFHHGGGDR